MQSRAGQVGHLRLSQPCNISPLLPNSLLQNKKNSVPHTTHNPQLSRVPEGHPNEVHKTRLRYPTGRGTELSTPQQTHTNRRRAHHNCATTPVTPILPLELLINDLMLKTEVGSCLIIGYPEGTISSCTLIIGQTTKTTSLTTHCPNVMRCNTACDFALRVCIDAPASFWHHHKRVCLPTVEAS